MSSPLQSMHAQSPSTKLMGSPQLWHSGGGPLSITGKGGSSLSSSSSGLLMRVRISSPVGSVCPFSLLSPCSVNGPNRLNRLTDTADSTDATFLGQTLHVSRGFIFSASAFSAL